MSKNHHVWVLALTFFKSLPFFRKTNKQSGNWFYPDSFDSLRLLLPAKIALFVCISIPIQLFPDFFNVQQWAVTVKGNTGSYPTAPPDVTTMLSAWDAQHYLSIAANGYPVAGPELAFYPLWPAVMNLFGPIFGGNLLLAGVVLANVFSLLAGMFLYDFVLRWRGKKEAWATLALLLAYPWSFFLAIPYSESLFLFLSVLLFWGMQKNHVGVVLLSAVLLPLSRPLGIVALAPVGFFGVSQLRVTGSRKNLLLPLAPVVGFVGYLLVMKQYHGDFLIGFDSQQGFIAQSKIMALFDFTAFFQALVLVDGKHNFFHSPFDRMAFFTMLVGIGFMVHRIVKGDNRWIPFLLWAVPCILIPAMTVKLMAFGRYSMVVFPLWIILGQLLATRTRLLALFLTICILGQIAFIWLHFNYNWVA